LLPLIFLLGSYLTIVVSNPYVSFAQSFQQFFELYPQLSPHKSFVYSIIPFIHHAQLVLHPFCASQTLLYSKLITRLYFQPFVTCLNKSLHTSVFTVLLFISFYFFLLVASVKVVHHDGYPIWLSTSDHTLVSASK
jgi:hypothetical protein